MEYEESYTIWNGWHFDEDRQKFVGCHREFCLLGHASSKDELVLRANELIKAGRLKVGDRK
jgi:hypothetical protein